MSAIRAPRCQDADAPGHALYTHHDRVHADRVMFIPRVVPQSIAYENGAHALLCLPEFASLHGRLHYFQAHRRSLAHLASGTHPDLLN